jgi:hypothetical protein
MSVARVYQYTCIYRTYTTLVHTTNLVFQTYLVVLQTAKNIAGNAENTLYIEVESRLRNIGQVVINARTE